MRLTGSNCGVRLHTLLQFYRGSSTLRTPSSKSPVQKTGEQVAKEVDGVNPSPDTSLQRKVTATQTLM